MSSHDDGPAGKSPRKAGKKTAAKKPAAKKSAASRKAPVEKAPRSRARGSTPEPTHEQIAERAYQIYEAEGGDHEQNWLRAERELRARG